MKARHKRLTFLAAGLAGLGVATVLVLNALENNMSYFFDASEVVRGEAPADHVFRLGGLVKPGTLQRGEELTVRFIVTDNAEEVPVAYTGILPDLFDEGQGVIAQGKLGPDGTFVAEEVLAKHDENYMAPEVAASMKGEHVKGVQKMAQETVVQ